VVLMALAGLWLKRDTGDNGLWDETVAVATPGTATALLAGEQPPSVDAMLGAAQPH
jgi:hypothetical protein